LLHSNTLPHQLQPSKWFPLTMLPEIMQAIMRGQVPATLSLDQLKKGFPLDWNEQQAKLGFFLS
jgi:hypothetical protein